MVGTFARTQRDLIGISITLTEKSESERLRYQDS